MQIQIKQKLTFRKQGLYERNTEKIYLALIFMNAIINVETFFHQINVVPSTLLRDYLIQYT